jgi:hypothetical protein
MVSTAFDWILSASFIRLPRTDTSPSVLSIETSITDLLDPPKFNMRGGCEESSVLSWVKVDVVVLFCNKTDAELLASGIGLLWV